MLVLLGGLILRGVEMGQFHSALGAAFYAVLVIAVLSVLTWTNARSLDRQEAERRRAEEALRRAHDELEARSGSARRS